MLGLSEALAGVPALAARWTLDLRSPIGAVAASPDGEFVAIALVEGAVAVVATDGGRKRWRHDGHAAGTLSLGWSPDGALLASSGVDGRAHLYDAATGRRTVVLDGGARWATRVAFEPNGERLATAAGPCLRLWRRDGSLAARWPDRSSTILDAAWRPAGAGRPLLAATSYGAVGLYDPLASGAPARELAWQGSSLALAWSSNAKYLATGDQDRSVHFWIVRSGRDLQMNGYPRKVRELSWHASSRYLATGGGNDPCVWDSGGRGPAGSTPLQLEFHEEPVSALAFQHAGDLLASGALDGTLAVWDLHAADRPAAVRGLGDEITALAWLPGDDAFVVATAAGDLACIGAPHVRASRARSRAPTDAADGARRATP